MPLDGFVHDLCVALIHRWEPERPFMILTAYFDESGTHAGSPVMVMAGLMGSAAQWGKFQRELDRLKKRYGFRIFHATAFKSRSGEFRGWDEQKSLGLVFDLADAVGQLLTEGVTFHLTEADYQKYYIADGRPRRPRLDTMYGLAFRACLSHLAFEMVRRFGHHKKFATLHVVLENGHRHKFDAERVFNEIRADLEANGTSCFGTFTLERKDHCDPLMAADFLAHTLYMTHIAGQLGPTEVNFDGSEQKAGLTHLEFGPGGLTALRDNLIALPRLKVGGKTVSGALLRVEPYRVPEKGE